MTLLECIQQSKELNKYFVPARKPLEEMTDEEVTYLAIHEYLKNDILVYASIVICRQNLMIKLFFKATLKDFLSKVRAQHANEQHV